VTARFREVANGDEIEIEVLKGDFNERRGALTGVAAAPEPLSEPRAEDCGPFLPVDTEAAEAGDLAGAVLALTGGRMT